MNLQEQLYSVLVVSASESFNDSLSELFPEYRYSYVKFVSGISIAKRELLERNYDFIFVNSPLPDDDGFRFSIDACANSSCVVAAFVRGEIYSHVIERMTSHGVYLIQKPTSKIGVQNRLEWMAATRERLRKLEKRNLTLEEKMKQIRIVNRAKWILIEQHKMTETEAHKYIEKQAMDRCISRERVAEEIINTYN